MTKSEIQNLLSGISTLKKKNDDLFEECMFHWAKVNATERANTDEIIRDFKVVSNDYLLFALDLLDKNIECGTILFGCNGVVLSDEFMLSKFVWYNDNEQLQSMVDIIDKNAGYRTNIFAISHESTYRILQCVYTMVKDFLNNKN